MGTLYEQLESALKPGMYVPEEFRLLYDWIEARGCYVDRNAIRTGFLFSNVTIRDSRTKNERLGGTLVEFSTADNASLEHWGIEPALALSRLCVFAMTGGDGSHAALWLDDNENQKIVHFGSGSGSLLCCVLAEAPVDFLRLLAIGYDEICWDEDYAYPPNTPEVGCETFIHPNVAYQEWVRTTFDVTIPERALDIVKCPAHFGERNSSDLFCRWVAEHAV